MTYKKVLLLSVSAGTGHTRAAEALRSTAAQLHADVETIHLDVLSLAAPPMRTVYSGAYTSLVKRAPNLWRELYRVTDCAASEGMLHRARRWAEKLCTRALRREIARFAPDLIICTHFLPAEILSRMTAAGALDVPVWVQITDFDLHRMWVHDGIAGYFAPSDEVAYRLREAGVPADKIFVTGIPIMPAFSRAPSRATCARELGISPTVKTVLLLGGGAGLGSVTAIAERLLQIAQDFQIVALAGKDHRTLTELQELAARHPGRLLPLGYTATMERLMACADMVVTKPGGLTTAETLAMALPMIAIAPIPGQEEHNANFLLERGAALKAFDLITLEYRIRTLLSSPAKLAAMRLEAKTLGRPDAASGVLAIALAKSIEIV
jgi:processive 1,2-diacylglycerol beta-glucosyltransferase